MNDMGESVELADRMLAQVYALLRERNIIPNAVQEQMLTSHVRAMAHRSVTGEPLPEVDASLFDEISAESMALARDFKVHRQQPGLFLRKIAKLGDHVAGKRH